LATLPSLTPAGDVAASTVSPRAGDESSPMVVASHNDPDKLVAVWTNANNPALANATTQIVAQAAFSNDGGQSWTPLNPGPVLSDPATSDPVLPFEEVRDASVAIDRNDRVYILTQQRSAGNDSGALVLTAFDFSGNSPTAVDLNPGGFGNFNAVYRWSTNPAFDPVVTVDDTVPSFTDPETGETVTNPGSGNVYISWISNDVIPALADPANFNPNRVLVAASSDGGVSFSAPQTLNDGGNFGTQRNAGPRLAVSQGTADGTIPAGQATVIWDDFGSGATAVPPRDFIRTEQISTGAAANVSVSGVPIQDSPGDDIVVTTDVTITVTEDDIPDNFTSLSDLDFQVSLIHPGLDQISMTLIPPQASGRPSVTLVLTEDLDGDNLGFLDSGAVGTTFDDSASRNIFDNDGGGGNANANPFADSFRPRFGSLQGAFDGMTVTAGPDGLLGNWTLRITDNGDDDDPQLVNSATLIMNSGLIADPDNSNNSTIDASFVRGGLDGIGQTTVAASPTPITPAPVIAADNTLGSFSPFQGRLYAAWVGHVPSDFLSRPNPTDNTDIHLAFSDDGGVTWTMARGDFNPLNDDRGNEDGFSEGRFSPLAGIIDGRPQFLPSLTVDQETGAVVAGWMDARHDAARSRVTPFVGASIDGGQTFSDQVFAGSPRIAIDAVTGREVALGPQPENQSPGNPVTDATFGFGKRIGLAAAGGQIVPVWPGNQNFIGINLDGANGSELLDIYTNPLTTAAGPRVDEGEMGPIEPTTETRLEDGSAIAYNDQTDADGTPIFDGLVVTFDRPVHFDPDAPIDPRAFSAEDVQVFFRDTTEENASGTEVATTDVIPLFDPTSPLTLEEQREIGPSRFLVRVAPRTGVGTYSYRVNPQEVSDRIRKANPDGTLREPGNLMDQDSDAVRAEPALTGVGIGDVFAAPNPTGQGTGFVVADGSGDFPDGFILGPFQRDTLPIVLPGPHLIAANPPGEPIGDPLAVDRKVGALDLTFDRDLIAGDFGPEDVLRIDGPAGPITGPFTVRPAFVSDDPALDIPDGDPAGITSDLVVPDVGDFTIQDLEVRLDIQTPKAADLRISLIAPDGTRVLLAQGVGGTIGEDFAGTVFDSGAFIGDGPTALTKDVPEITEGSAPFAGRFRPLETLEVLQGLPVEGTWQLEVVDENGGNLDPGAVQQLLGWSLTAKPQSSGSGAQPVARTFRVDFFETDPLDPTLARANLQEISGTYTAVIGPEIRSARGDLLDADLDAGVDLLRGVDPAGSTVNVTASSSEVPVQIPTDGTPATSTLTISDDFLIQGLTVRLNIQHPNTQNLTVELIPPAAATDPDAVVTLFSPNVLNVPGSNFTNTVIDDNAATFIGDAGPPFFGTFRPEQPLSNAFLDESGNPRRSTGTYQLRITDNTPSGSGGGGALLSWSLNFRKPVTNDGLGEEVADRSRASFRIFTMDPTDPVSSSIWTAVGPAPAAGDVPGTNWTGRIGAIAVDPSDPTGNTVFVGGASGGVWKTENFLTDDPSGPTYIPLTDFGPNFSPQIGSIAVFGRNNDPNQSILFVATGEGDDSAGFGTNQTGTGIGFLRSMDGGRTWEVLDSTDNTFPNDSPSRDRAFVGSSSFKVVVDPTPTTEGEVIVYAALAGPNGGLWRSTDTGDTWEKLSVDAIHGTTATDLVLDPFSADETTGVLDRFHVAFRADGTASAPGVYRATSRGDNLTQLIGGIGKPLVQDPEAPPDSIDVGNPNETPPTGGRIVLAQPTPSDVAVQDISYQDWLYAAAVEGGSLTALYMTKDRGENWTRVLIPSTPNDVPSNDPTTSSLDFGKQANADFALSLAVDPNDPHVVYLGSTLGGSTGSPAGARPNTLIRLDTRLVHDAHNLTFFDPDSPDGGLTQLDPLNTTASSPAVLKDVLRGLTNIFDVFGNSVPYSEAINLVRNPATPLAANSTFFVFNAQSFANSGADVLWTDVGAMLQGADTVHDLLTLVDPLTGNARLIAGTDQGVFSAVDNDGDFQTAVGNAEAAFGTRNGNLQLAQVHQGAVQPNSLAAQAQNALFHAMSWQIDFPASDPNILENGNLVWTDRDPLSALGSGTGVATAQVDGPDRGTVFQFKWPTDGGRFTDFFQVNNVGRTVGLLQGQNDPQWPGVAPILDPGIRFGDFAVNPINNNQIIISSAVGRLFGTTDQGRTWREIGAPAVFGGPNLGAYGSALAFGAPDPGVTAPGSLDDFLYVGTNSGRIFVSRTGGGAAGTEWTEISNGLDGSTVLSILTSPDRGTREAYAVTQGGVFYIPDSTAPGATWQNITGNLFDITQKPFGQDALTETALEANQLHSIVADWRYLIPEDPDDPDSPAHPILYAAGHSGVFRSIDNGQTWTTFPNNIASGDPLDGTAADLGFLPNVRVTDLDLSLGFINPDNGRNQITPESENLLLASTFGRGQFAIRLAPLVIEEFVQLSETLPDPPGPPGGSDSGSGFDPGDFEDRVTNVTNPVFEGLSEQTAFGNVVRITLFDLTDPTDVRIIGGFDPSDPATDIPAHRTDAEGRFTVQVRDDAFADDGSDDGPKVIGIQAVNDSGTTGNLVRFEMTLDTTEPVTPTIPDLTDASDSNDDGLGMPPVFSRTDDYTNDTSPTFTVSDIEENVTLILRRNGEIVTIDTAVGAGGDVQITDAGPLEDGIFTYTAQQVDKAGNLSEETDPLTVTIDTAPPAAPGELGLDPATDTGNLGDGITGNVQPTLIGALDLASNEITTENRPLVQILDEDGGFFGQARVDQDGSFAIALNQPLEDGTFTFLARAIDRAGNLGPDGPTFDLTILTAAPPDVTLDLSPTDDTGVPGDNITSVRRPRLLGETGPNLMVQLIDFDGAITGTPGTPIGAPVPSQLDGVFLIRVPDPLPDGTFSLVAQVEDIAGNVNQSNPLLLTIDSTPPEAVPDLRLAPDSDTGIQGDGITSNRRPFLVGTTDPNADVEIVGPNGAILAAGVSDDNGEFRLRLASNLVNGQITIRSRVRDVAGNVGALSEPLDLRIVTTRGDYDLDAQADLALFRPEGPNGSARFLLSRSQDGPRAVDFGRDGDIPLAGDFDGDGLTDIAVFRPESDSTPGASEWFILGTRTGPRSLLFGGAGLDLPAVGDFDGDGVADIGVFRPDSDLLPGASEYFILRSSDGPLRFQFGAAGLDVPVPADFDGDGQDDLAVFRPDSDLNPGSAQFFILQSTDGPLSVPLGEANSDVPVQGDFDGDGQDDLAVFEPSTARWLIRNSSDGSTTETVFGAPADIPVPADFDNDGRADLTTYRPRTGQWTSRRTSDDSVMVTSFGGPEDVPVLAPLAFRDFRPGTVVSPDFPGGDTGSGSASLRAASTSPSRPVGAPLDFGGQAIRLARGENLRAALRNAPTSPTSPLGLGRFRPAQALAEMQAAREDGIEGDFELAPEAPRRLRLLAAIRERLSLWRRLRG